MTASSISREAGLGNSTGLRLARTMIDQQAAVHGAAQHLKKVAHRHLDHLPVEGKSAPGNDMIQGFNTR
jgi:hypothetical protein